MSDVPQRPRASSYRLPLGVEDGCPELVHGQLVLDALGRAAVAITISIEKEEKAG